MKEFQGEDVEMQQVEAVPVVNPLMLDRVYRELLESCVILEDFTQMPAIRQSNGQIYFIPPNNNKSGNTLINVVNARQEYYDIRLALAEERVFSHTDKYVRAKLNSGTTAT